MKALRIILRNLGIEGWIFGLTGLIAIVFSVLGLFGIWPFNQTQTLQIIVGAIGALILTVIAQNSRRHIEIIELKEILGTAETHLMNSYQEFGQHLALNTLRTHRFILDTLLNRAAPRPSSPTLVTGHAAEFRRLTFERVTKGELVYKRVEVIFHKENLEETIHRLLLHEGYNYFIRYYEPSPKAIPIINMISLDDEMFYLGGFYPRESPGTESVLYIREPKLAGLLEDYWGVLWNEATPLNEGKVIDWAEIKCIASKIGLSESETEAMIAQVKENVRREKRKLQHK